MTRKQRLVLLAGAAALLFLACAPAATPTITQPPATAVVATPAPATPTATPRVATTPAPRPTATPLVAAAPKYGGSLTVGNFLAYMSWDPFVASTYRIHSRAAFLHDRLFVFKNAPGCGVEVEPSLAQSWKWLNDTTLEVKLQPGARFANRPPVNGREITADDVVYSYSVQVPRNPGIAPFIGGILDRVEAVDKSTVRFKLTRPHAFFVQQGLNRYAYIVAKETFGANNALIEANNVGNGPFILKDHQLGVSATFLRNPDYWRKDIPYIDSMYMKEIPDLSTQMAALRGGKLDVTYWQTQHSLIIEAQKSLRDYQVQVCLKPNPPTVGMVVAGKPFDDVRVRRAISMGIDRQTLLKTVYEGMSQLIATGVTQAHGDFYLPVDKLPPEAQRYLEYRPADAKRLLAEAGYPDGLKTRIWYTTNFGIVFRGIAESMAASFAAAGIKADLYSPEYALFWDRWNKGTFDGLLIAWFSGMTFGEILDDGYRSGGRHSIFYKYPSSLPVDTLIDQLTSTLDREKQKRLAYEIQIAMAQELPVIALPPTLDAAVVANYVKNVYYFPTWDLWVDYLKAAWIER